MSVQLEVVDHPDVALSVVRSAVAAVVVSVVASIVVVVSHFRFSFILCYMSLAEAAIFEYALKLGMQLTIETLIE